MNSVVGTSWVTPGKTLGTSVVRSSALTGLEAVLVHVEVSCSRGPAFFQMVGQAQTTVREARVRVASALAQLGVFLEEYAITINLAPAELRKTGAGLDLAMALGVLAAIGRIPPVAEDALILGELGLDGALRPVRGVLPQLAGARDHHVRWAMVPLANQREAGLVRELEVFAPAWLADAVAHMASERRLVPVGATPYEPGRVSVPVDLGEVRGQAAARRALEIAAAGGHNLLMVGPPGSGKTLLARALPGVLPPMTFREAWEATAIHSVAGLVEPEVGIVATRPFRAPHHSVSDAGLVGGGEYPRPGEVSLAHHGVLFLDELAEFRRGALEGLRQPLEDKKVCISRARARVWFPAHPLVVAAVNPCPCGYAGHPSRPCRCSAQRRRAYLGRLSGPLLDRLDLHVAVPPVELRVLAQGERGESTAAVRERVCLARELQRRRHAAGQVSVDSNGSLSGADLEQVAPLGAEVRRLMEQAVSQLGLSARAFLRVRRVARTIADLDGAPVPSLEHFAEALQGRLFDREPL